MPSVADLVVDLHERDQANRSAGNFGAVVLLDQDEMLTRLVACWENVPASAMPSGDTLVPDALPEHAHLRWLWAMLEPDPIPTWLRIAGLPDAPHTRRACWVAIDNRMVLPDGRVSSWVTTYLSRSVAARIAGRGRR